MKFCQRRMNLLLKTYIFCTKRCLATVSNNSATAPFSLLVIRNGRQEVHARTLTSVCKSGIKLETTWTGPKGRPCTVLYTYPFGFSPTRCMCAALASYSHTILPLSTSSSSIDCLVPMVLLLRRSAPSHGQIISGRTLLLYCVSTIHVLTSWLIQFTL